MAKIIIIDNNNFEKTKEIPNNSEIKDVCEELGLEFGCKNGFCRTCEVTVIEGYDNLSELNENEEFIGLIKPRRLMCQCKVKSGIVKIKID